MLNSFKEEEPHTNRTIMCKYIRGFIAENICRLIDEDKSSDLPNINHVFRVVLLLSVDI